MTQSVLVLIGWCILLVLRWPLALMALMALIIWPIAWLISIPLKLISIGIGIGIGAALALINTILFLPARMLGYRG